MGIVLNWGDVWSSVEDRGIKLSEETVSRLEGLYKEADQMTIDRYNEEMKKSTDPDRIEAIKIIIDRITSEFTEKRE